jgi:hypothetical protein
LITTSDYRVVTSRASSKPAFGTLYCFISNTIINFKSQQQQQQQQHQQQHKKMPPAPGQEEPIKRISKIVDWLITRQDLQPFLEPVDWRGLELYDYPKIISKMMDLGTIKRRLERGQYSTTHQIAEDIRLVWKNCMAYNSDGYVKVVCFCGVCGCCCATKREPKCYMDLFQFCYRYCIPHKLPRLPSLVTFHDDLDQISGCWPNHT